jgi:hypothetical protein
MLIPAVGPEHALLLAFPPTGRLQLPGCRQSIGGHPPGKPAHRLSALSAQGLGRRSAPPGDRRCARGRPIPNQARDCLAAVAPGGGRWRGARRGADGPGLWQRQQTAGWDQSTWPNLRGRHFGHHNGLAARRSPVAAHVQSRPRPPGHAVAPRRDASEDLRQTPQTSIFDIVTLVLQFVFPHRQPQRHRPAMLGH